MAKVFRNQNLKLRFIARHHVYYITKLPANHGSIILTQISEENPQLRLHSCRDPGTIALTTLSHLSNWFDAPLIWVQVDAPRVAAGKEATSRSSGGKPVSATEPLDQGDKMGLKVLAAVLLSNCSKALHSLFKFCSAIQVQKKECLPCPLQ